MKKHFKAGGEVWFSVHLFVFTCIMLMILLSYSLFGSIFTDEQIGNVCVFWAVLMLVEGIHGLWGWRNDVE